MFDSDIQKALNNQINKELEAWYNYLAMSAFFHRSHLNGFAAFMNEQALEEQTHANRLISYVLDRGGEVDLQAIQSPNKSFGSALEVFSRALEQEEANTKAIYELYELAKDRNDYSTVAALQWFLDEQVEEEKVMGESLGLVRFAGEDKSALLSLNREFGQRRGRSAQG
jgi:ferritin